MCPRDSLRHLRQPLRTQPAAAMQKSNGPRPGQSFRAASSRSPARTRRLRWRLLQNSANNLAAKLAAGGFQFAARGSHVPCDSFLSRLNFAGCAAATLAQARVTLFQNLLARRFLFGINFSARLSESILISAFLFLRSRLARLRSALRAYRSFPAFVQYLLHGTKEVGAKKQIKEENDQDCGHSLQEQFAKLVNNFHSVVMPVRSFLR